jgi:hypothetical protein
MLCLKAKRRNADGKRMKWLEMIKIQAALGREGTVANELKALKNNVRKNPDCSGLSELIICNHASIPGYFAICLVWESRNLHTAGSLTGLNVSQSLRAFGLVDHSVWVEKEEPSIR